MYCTTCQGQISRGRAGYPRAKLNSSGMTVHLKKHKNVWQEFQEARKNTPLEIEKENVLGRKWQKLKKGPIWKYFVKDQADPTSVSCNLCQVRISRGHTVSSTSLTHHLKSNHFNDWETYVNKRDAVNMEQAKKIYEPEGSAWQ